MHTRCPSCNNAVEVLVDSSLKDVECPACGSSFNILGDDTVAYEPADSTQQYQGRTIGQFQLLEQVGVGAFGSVWRAKDTQLDRTVAVKIPRRDQLSSEDAEQFLREGRRPSAAP